ncbi:MAG: PTS transporter subunit EIIB [Verrucomicrobia bacterium]|nr:PTS transporter subunit EIIB [Verrucomicrobiota bacterium]MBV8274660.1 PTS transporter subunit EIIB [Verrucomicrobiota bacterium]
MPDSWLFPFQAAGIQPKLRDPLAAEKARTVINALGGKPNIQRVEACAETRLRRLRRTSRRFYRPCSSIFGVFAVFFG